MHICWSRLQLLSSIMATILWPFFPPCTHMPPFYQEAKPICGCRNKWKMLPLALAHRQSFPWVLQTDVSFLLLVPMALYRFLHDSTYLIMHNCSIPIRFWGPWEFQVQGLSGSEKHITTINPKTFITRFKSWLYHLVRCVTLGSFLTSLILSFFTWKRR